MKTVKILSLAFFSTTLFFSCKNEEKPKETKKAPENNLAIIDTANKTESITNSESSEFLYVTSLSGLSLREYNNLQSEKLAIMPYGTKVKVITSEKKPTMKVGTIAGGMNEVEYNHKKGYAFNGYLSKYFPPEKGISAKRYSEELIRNYPKVKFSETKGGTASNPKITETIVLPEAKWHEAFYIAKQLFELPKEFEFPSSKGKEKEVILERKFKKKSWVSELQVERKNNELVKIEYLYKNKGFTRKVNIIKKGNDLIISNYEEVK